MRKHPISRRNVYCTGGARRFEHHEIVIMFDEGSQERFVSYKFLLCISAPEHGRNLNLQIVVKFNSSDSLVCLTSRACQEPLSMCPILDCLERSSFTCTMIQCGLTSFSVAGRRGPQG